MTDPQVSILLLTRNGAASLPRVLDQLDRQQTRLRRETVAVDSGSTDGTRPLLRARCDRVIDVAPGSFNHGLTRNLGVAGCSGELVVLLVQDAVPASPGWLDALVAPLLDDAALAGTFARQIPKEDASPVTRHYHRRWAAASRRPRRAAVTPERFWRLDPAQRHQVCVFDNVCSCIRRSVWNDHPFPRAAIAEDLAWAREVLLAGHQLAYVPGAAVIHSHDRGPGYELRRTYLVHRELFELFQLRTIPSVAALARAVAASSLTHLRCVAGTPSKTDLRGCGRALGLALAWPLGQYLGGLSAARRWPALDLGAV